MPAHVLCPQVFGHVPMEEGSAWCCTVGCQSRPTRPPAHTGEATSPHILRPSESEGAHRTSRDREGTCARSSDECALQPSTSSPLVGEVARQGVTTGMPAQGCAAGAADMPAQGSAAGVHVVSNLRQCQRESSASTSASTFGSSAQTHSRAFRPLDDDGLCSSSPSSSLPNSATGSCPSHPWERFPFPHPASPYHSAVAGNPAVTPAIVHGVALSKTFVPTAPKFLS